MKQSPPPSPSQHVTAHAYASNGLEILQAASDAAAHCLDNQQALQNAAAAAAEVVAEPTEMAPTNTAAAAVAAAATSSPPPLPHPLSLPVTHHQDHHLHAHHVHEHHQPHVMRDPTINPKLTRLRRACDMCSMRKVKCDDSNIPCRPCRELGVDCTYEREMKRRGPPNKHAEAAKAAKRARLELDGGPGPGPGTGAGTGTGSTVDPPAASASAAASNYPSAASFSSPHNAARTLMTISSDGLLDAEAIAPMPVLELLVDDFFTYIHPLAPFPHEPTFRHSFANREDRSRPEFLGLLASMVAALVASFPRSAREHLKSQHGHHLYPRPVVMVDRCRDITLLTRGSKWVLKQPKTHDDAATSYFLGLASAYTDQWNTSRYLMAETLTLIRELGFVRSKHLGVLPTFGNDSYSADPLPFNHVKDQIGKRIFWCLLLAVRSFSQLGASHTPADLIIAPSTPSLPYPACPENVDDICVLANEIIHQPEGSVTLLTGFRFAIDIYTTMNGVISLELAYGMSTLPWADQRLLLRDGLVAAKSIMDNLPPELQLGSQMVDEANSLASLVESGLQYVPPLWPAPQPAHDLRNIIKTQPLRRRQLQHEIQKVNIYVSQLATRSYFVELYFTLRDVHLSEQQEREQRQQQRDEEEEEEEEREEGQDEQKEQRQQEQKQQEQQQQQQREGSGGVQGPSEEEKALQEADDKEVLEFMSEERELLVQNLLTILGSLSQRNLEPNGGSLINKLRQVALMLVHDAPERKGLLALKADEALSQLVEVLGRLNGSSATTNTATSSSNSNSSATSAAALQRPLAGQTTTAAPAATVMSEADELNELRHWADLRNFQLRFAADGSGCFADVDL